MQGKNESTGFRTIGSLMTDAVSSLDPAASTLTSRPARCETGRSDKLPAAPIGKQHTGTGVAVVRANSELETALAASDAWRSDKALLASLPRPVASSLVSKIGPEFDVVGYSLRNELDRSLAQEALALVELACAPAPDKVIVTELTRCLSVTKARERAEVDLELAMLALVDGLSEFPADVVRDACRAWAKCEVFHPSLAELREFCWRRFRARDGLRRALRAA